MYFYLYFLPPHRFDNNSLLYCHRNLKICRALLAELEKFLDFEDEIILNFYNFNIVKKEINKNKVSKIFQEFKI